MDVFTQQYCEVRHADKLLNFVLSKSLVWEKNIEDNHGDLQNGYLW